MPTDFTYDAGSVPSTKTDLVPIGANDPTKWLQAVDVNQLSAACASLRNAILGGRYVAMNDYAAPVSAAASWRAASINGQMQVSESGGAYGLIGKADQVSASASGGTFTPAVKKDQIAHITLDANLTLADPVLSLGAALVNGGIGTRLTLVLTQDSTGYRKWTISGTHYKDATNLLPRQGPGQRTVIEFVLSADGFWTLKSHNAIDTRKPLHVLDYGADPTNTVDSAPAINACIFDAATVYLTKAILDHGQYRTDDTIHLGYGTGFSKAILEGDGYAYNGGGFAGAALIPTKSDRPAINFQGGRGSALRGVAIIGKLTNWIQTNHFCDITTTPTVDDTVEANWSDPSLAVTQDSRYAPYAAITVDAYAGNQPATHYPAVSYPASLGTVAQYNKNFSSECTIEDVQVIGFNTAVANQPCDADGNGDFTRLIRCNITFCKYGLSVGNTQARNFGVTDCTFSMLHTFLVNTKHGRQNGKVSGVYSNLSGGASIQVLNLPNGTGVAGPVTFTQFYGEAMYRIGTVGCPTGVETAVVFDQAQFSFDMTSGVRGHPATFLDGGGVGDGYSSILFRGCVFTNFYSVFMVAHAHARFEDCQCSSVQRFGTPTVAAYQEVAHNALMGGLVLPALVRDYMLGSRVALYDLDSLIGYGTVKMRDHYKLASRKYGCPLYVGSVEAGGADEGESLTGPQLGNVTGPGEWTSPSISGCTLTFTFSRADWQAEMHGFAPGDVLWDQNTNTVFFIRSRTGTSTSTVIAEAQNNFKSDGMGGYVLIAPVDVTPSGGNMYAASGRAYTPNYPLFADSTSGSNILTNAGRRDGYFASTDIAVGDRMWVSEYGERWFYANGTKVTAIDGVGNTITLEGNANLTTVGHRLTWFMRQPPPNT